MINLTEIKKFYPTVQGFDRGILREYLQYKILDILFSHPLATKLSFLGGTAIKICYGSQRFSEDLDFDNFSLSVADFRVLTDHLQQKLTAEGFLVESRVVIKGAFHCYVKFSQILQEQSLSELSDEKIMIQIDTVPHGFIYQPESWIMQKFAIFRQILVTPKDVILSQKIAALLGRKRAKGRDLYDIVFLLGQTDFNYDYLQQKLKIKNQSELKSVILSKIENYNLPDLLNDVQPFLLQSDDKNMVLLFKEFINQKL